MAEREFTGKHFLAIFVAAFSVIIAVNLVLAYSAVHTFPGLEVKNSYVASQEFNSRLHEQESLGWAVSADTRDGQVVLAITDSDGNPVRVRDLQAVLGRATHVRDDFTPDFVFDGAAYVADAQLGRGNWNLRMVARAEDGTEFRQRVVLHVKG